MTRINVETGKNFAGSPGSIAWGKQNVIQALRNVNTSPVIFAVLLLICSLTVGCSHENSKPASANVQLPAEAAPMPSVATNAPVTVVRPEPKPAPKRAIRRRPATVTYSDAASGVQFEYPRRYALETGDAATSLVASSPLPMDFIQPGGTALAAVELPESSYANTDFSSGYFSVAMHKSLTADQCNEFSVPEKKADSANDDNVFLLGDMELKAAEAVAGQGDSQSDSKYFHAFENGTCYEFALNVTTLSPATEGQMKHVNRDQVFNRLEKIMATLKINPLASPEQTASTPDATASEQKGSAQEGSVTPEKPGSTSDVATAPATQAVPADTTKTPN